VSRISIGLIVTLDDRWQVQQTFYRDVQECAGIFEQRPAKSKYNNPINNIEQKIDNSRENTYNYRPFS
jgi:hypothetical protein